MVIIIISMVASDFELAGRIEHPLHGGKFRPSSRWDELLIVHYEHTIHPFHPNCTSVAPELHQKTHPKSTGLAARYQNNMSILFVLSGKISHCHLFV